MPCVSGAAVWNVARIIQRFFADLRDTDHTQSLDGAAPALRATCGGREA
jgi:hypothetical protein